MNILKSYKILTSIVHVEMSPNRCIERDVAEHFHSDLLPAKQDVL